MQITPYPIFPIPTKAQWEADPDKCREYIEKREWKIEQAKENPYDHGYRPEIWRRADELWVGGAKEILILGGNRAGKTFYAAEWVLKKLLSKDNARVWCFQTDWSNSVEMQQPAVYAYLRPEFKRKKKDVIFNVSYSQKNGFSGDTFILPNGSQCFFRHYSQDITSIEGGEIDAAWCDELVPLEWLETLRYRLVTRSGDLLVTFTPVQGYTPTVKSYIQGAKTLESCDAPLLGHQKVPRLQQPQRKTARIIYFHTSDNPFGGYDSLKTTLQGAPRNEILCRAYGVPTKAAVERFPKFNEKIHVVSQNRIPTKGSRYLIVDPCSGRNWFMSWLLVDARNRYFFYREWPSPGQYIPGIGDPGSWAEPSGKLHDGASGPAQRGFGWGLLAYKREIERIESEADETIELRLIDSRYANTKTLHRDNPTTLLEECLQIGLEFVPAPTDSIDEGVDLINSMLDYDASKPIGIENEPQLYFSESCQNMTFAMQEWTGADGKDGATKDPIDVIRYAVLAKLPYQEDQSYILSGVRTY